MSSLRKPKQVALVVVVIVLVLVSLAVGSVAVWLATKPVVSSVECGNGTVLSGAQCVANLVDTSHLTIQNNTIVPTDAVCPDGSTLSSETYTCSNLPTTCPTLGAGVSTDNTTNPPTIVPDLVDTTHLMILNDKVVPTNAVCPTNSTLGANYVCSDVPTTTCPTLGAGVSTDNTTNPPTIVPELVDTTHLTILNNQVVPTNAVCPTNSTLGANYVCSDVPTTTCPTLGAGVSTDNTTNPPTIVPDLVDTTHLTILNNQVVPTNAVCPNNSTLLAGTYKCSDVPATKCPTFAGNIMVDPDNSTNLIINTDMIANPSSKLYPPSANDKVVWRDNQCQSTCPTGGPNVVYDNGNNTYVVNDQVCPKNSQLNNTTFVCSSPPQDCTVCDLSKTSKTADPATWLTCNASACQGSLLMTQKSTCNKQLGTDGQSGEAGTAGIDFAGMFACLNGNTPTNTCPYGDIATACSGSKCSSFTLDSDSNNRLRLQACDNSGTKLLNTTTAVAFSPFGNSLASKTQQSLGQTTLKRKLPGWD